MSKIRIKIDEAWASYWRLWSMKLKAIGLVLGTISTTAGDVWSSMPPDLRHLLPYAQWLSYAMFAMAMFAAVVKQPQATEVIQQKREAKTNG